MIRFLLEDKSLYWLLGINDVGNLPRYIRLFILESNWGACWPWRTHDASTVCTWQMVCTPLPLDRCTVVYALLDKFPLGCNSGLWASVNVPSAPVQYYVMACELLWMSLPLGCSSGLWASVELLTLCKITACELVETYRSLEGRGGFWVSVDVTSA